MQAAILSILFFVVTECEILASRAHPKDDFIKFFDSVPTRQSKNDKPLYRYKWDSFKSATSKWPKVQRKATKQPVSRITKMYNKLQEGEETTVIDLHQSEEATSYSYEYFSPYSIKDEIERVVAGIRHTNITVTVVGRTKEYLDIVLLKITEENPRYFRTEDNKYVDEKPDKKIVFIAHGLSVMGMRHIPCFIKPKWFGKLLSYYTKFLDKFDIFLLPMANPDGVAVLRSNTYWNKNSAPQAECVGVAIDRNFDVAWGSNNSVNSCSQEYPGAMPFSEVESRVVRDILHKYSHKIIAYFHVHPGTYGPDTLKGDAVLYPKGYTDSITDEDKYIDLKGEIDEAIRNASLQVYLVAVETLYNWYGRVTGSSVDYASTVYGIPFALELVMQLYEDSDFPKSEITYTETALTEVWRRVINVILNFISKSTDKEKEVW